MTLYRETPCDKCGVFHVGGKRDDPGAGCWAKPGGFREEVTRDSMAEAVHRVLLRRGWATPGTMNSSMAYELVDAALRSEKETASTV